MGSFLDIICTGVIIICSFFKCQFHRAKANLATTRLDLYINGELLDPAEDRRLVGDIPLRDRTVSDGQNRL